jgi:hypothetical protein
LQLKRLIFLAVAFSTKDDNTEGTTAISISDVKNREFEK